MGEPAAAGFGEKGADCLDLMKAVDSPCLRCAFDFANFVQVGVRPYDEAWPPLADHVAHFHVKDAVAVDRQGGPPYPAPAPEFARPALRR